MADPTKVSHMHLSLFPMASLVGHQPIAAVNIKKRKNIHKYCFAHAFLPIYPLFDLTHTSQSCSLCYMHTNNPDHFFISRSLSAERGRDTAELDIGEPKQSASSLGLFPLILCRHLLSSRTHMHKHCLQFLSVSPSALYVYWQDCCGVIIPI